MVCAPGQVYSPVGVLKGPGPRAVAVELPVGTGLPSSGGREPCQYQSGGEEGGFPVGARPAISLARGVIFLLLWRPTEPCSTDHVFERFIEVRTGIRETLEQLHCARTERHFTIFKITTSFGKALQPCHVSDYIVLKAAVSS